MPSPRLVAAFIVIAVAACGAGGDNAASDTSAASSAGQPSAGERNFTQRCASCHQPNGEGLAGVYPPLAGSEYAVSANPSVPIQILLHGIDGPITVNGTEYNGLMPAYGVGIVMSDEEVAGVLTYVRSSWGNSASAVTAADVAKVREETKDHSGTVTSAMLRPLMNP